MTTETANLMRTLKAGGADVVLCASNPLSTQDDVAAALVDEYGDLDLRDQGRGQRHVLPHIEAAVDHKPHITMDDGADVIGVLHSARREQLGDVIAGTEETTTGVIRLKALERDGKLGFPVDRGQRGEDEAPLRQPLRHGPVDDRRHHPRDQRPARRQASSSSPATAGVGRGVAMRAKGLGAHVIVTEVDPMPALEAVMDGFEVLSMEKAATIGDIFCTATGDKSVVAKAHLEQMKDGAILCNTGHFNVEIEIAALRDARDARRGRPASSSRSSRSPTAAGST